jgi:diguanylate cyclase (GGDEF)-like protein
MTEPSPIRILLVEDNPGDVRLVGEMLTASGAEQYLLNHAGTIKHALELLAQNYYDVLLLDLSLPDGHGLSNVTKIQTKAPGLPIVVLSSISDEQLALEVVKAGVQDYLVKGRGDAHLLMRAMRYAIERKHSDERLVYLAHYDHLTNLPNRVLFRDRMTRALAHAQRNTRRVALLFLDLDHFKTINDTLGHDAGDELLVSVARRLETCVRKHDTIARLGGDEFTAILENIDDADDAAAVAQKIVDTMSRSFQIEGRELFVTVSIGIALFPTCGLDPATLIKNADTALYSAKDNGRSCFKFYSSHMHNMASEHLSMVTALRHALPRGEFLLEYQPQIDPRTHHVLGVEALLRWNHPEQGLLPPTAFIPLLEDSGMIVEVGEWVLRSACLQLNAWQAAGLPPMRMCINTSARQFRPAEFIRRVATIVAETGVDPNCLQFEVTESLLIDNVASTTAKLRALRSIGIQIAIDDFGTGYCSLNYLKQFPLHVLKLDRSFIKDIESRSNDAAIVTAMIALGHSLDMEVIAEGVETEGQLMFLRGQGCDAVQGFLYSGPMAASAWPTWLAGFKTQTRSNVTALR